MFKLTGLESDLDLMECNERFPVIADIAQSDINLTLLLIIRELHTPAGYVKLQFVERGVPCTSEDVIESLFGVFRTDTCGRIVLGNIPIVDRLFFFDIFPNKPALKSASYYGMKLDLVRSFRCRTWPSFAQEWISRKRYYGWPSKDTVEKLTSLGFF